MSIAKQVFCVNQLDGVITAAGVLRELANTESPQNHQKELENENLRLKKLIAELPLNKAMLDEVSNGNLLSFRPIGHEVSP